MSPILILHDRAQTRQYCFRLVKEVGMACRTVAKRAAMTLAEKFKLLLPGALLCPVKSARAGLPGASPKLWSEIR